MRDKHEVAKGKNCRFCKTVWPGKEDLHAHLVRDHGKTLHLCGDCGNNYANEKSQGTHVKKCPQRNQQPQPQNELFALDAREKADNPGFDAALEIKEEEADEDEMTSETTSDVVEASFGSEKPPRMKRRPVKGPQTGQKPRPPRTMMKMKTTRKKPPKRQRQLSL